jgi:hypothetical protein
MRLRRDHLYQRGLIQRVSKRWKVSATIEPPLDSQVLEKPCSVILMEDRAIYKDSWHEPFQSAIPRDYGMSFASISFPEGYSFDQMLGELKDDLPTIHDAVLVARGPLSSWCSQLYLESFPLQGLVMVDPMLINQVDAATMHTMFQEMLPSGYTSQVELGHWNGLINGAQARELKLEPNAVPMLVVNVEDGEAWKRAAHAVARRHSDNEGPYGDVLVKELSPKEIADVIPEIDSWIDSIL